MERDSGYIPTSLAMSTLDVLNPNRNVMLI